MKPHHQDDDRAVWHIRIATLPRAVVEHRFEHRNWTGHYEDTGKLLEDYELRAVVELGGLELEDGRLMTMPKRQRRS